MRILPPTPDNGSIVRLGKALLRSNTNVAKSVLLATHGSIEKFNDIIDLGGQTPLVKSFENATVIAKLILPTIRLLSYVFESLGLLRL